jgi:mercuric ion transport protein
MLGQHGPTEDGMKCCDTNEEKNAREEGQNKLSGLTWLGIVGTVLTCIACFTPLAVTLLGVIGLARWAGYFDYVLFPLLALFVGLPLVGLVRRRQNQTQEGES